MVLAIGGGPQLFCPALFVRTRLRPIFPLLAMLILPVSVEALELSKRSVSPSGQFIIYGDDAGYRGTISGVAERTKAHLLAVLQRRDGWRIAVVVNLRQPAANLPEIPAIELRFSQTETGLKLQFNLVVGLWTNPAAIERELAKVIVLEMIYRTQTGITSGDVFVDPPIWLVDGLLASPPNRDRASLVTALSVPQRPPSLNEFLHQRPESLDSAARQLYRSYSFVLVQMLMESSDGPKGLGRYIDNLASASNDPMGDLETAFPEVRDFERAWKSKIAELKGAPDKGLLTFSATNAKLNELLSAKFPPAGDGEKSLSLEDFSRTKPTPAQRLALQKFSHGLVLLKTRANPVLRHVIEDYQQITDALVFGNNRRVATRLAELSSLRSALSDRMSDIDDYMNWFEAVKLETPSGVFDNYLKASSEMRAPKRKDPLSVYLDAMEMEF
jgi:hypothetical protein